MKKHILIFLIVILNFSCVYSQKSEINHSQIKEDLYQMLNDISQYYAYQKDKNVDLNCLLEYYESQIPNIKTEEETVLFFEYILDEFYDSHLMLNTNRNSSFRLHSPIYATLENGTPRENYVPTNFVKQTTTEKDEVLEKGIQLINKMTE
jgi:hypothetical protein